MSPAIYLIVEGDTENAFKDRIKKFMDEMAGNMRKVGLKIKRVDGSLSEKALKSRCPKYLDKEDCVGVVALSDVYPNFKSAGDAKKIVQKWMPEDSRCHAHAAQYDVEAWLLTDWPAIMERARIQNKQPWGSNPEEINDKKPPAHRLGELFLKEGNPQRHYDKIRDGKHLMDKLNLIAAAQKCMELKAFLNTLLVLAGYAKLK